MRILIIHGIFNHCCHQTSTLNELQLDGLRRETHDNVVTSICLVCLVGKQSSWFVRHEVKLNELNVNVSLERLTPFDVDVDVHAVVDDNVDALPNATGKELQNISLL